MRAPARELWRWDRAGRPRARRARLLRRRQSRRRAVRRQGLCRHHRRPPGRARRRDRRGLGRADDAGRRAIHDHRRAARRRRQGHHRQRRRRARRARFRQSAYDARDRHARLALLHRARRSVEGRLRSPTGARSAPRKLGPASGGRWAAAARRGMRSPTTPRRSCCTSAPATARRGTAHCAAPAAATICICRRSSRSNVETGELVWHYQTTPGDKWDYTAVQQLMLAELPIGGRDAQGHHAGAEERLLLRARSADRRVALGRSDRAKSRGQRASTCRTGRPDRDNAGALRRGRGDASARPGGAHNWQPMSFNPATGLVYIPAIESSFVYGRERRFPARPGFWNLGIDLAARTGSVNGVPSLPRVRVLGAAPARRSARRARCSRGIRSPRSARWRVMYTEGAIGGGTLTTAGNLVFQGLRRRASSSRTRRTRARSVGRWMSATASWRRRARTRSTASSTSSVLVGHGAARPGCTPAIRPRNFKATGRRYTFVLDGAAPLPPVRGIAQTALTPIASDARRRPNCSRRGAVRRNAARCATALRGRAAARSPICATRHPRPTTRRPHRAPGRVRRSACRSSTSSPRPISPR